MFLKLVGLRAQQGDAHLRLGNGDIARYEPALFKG
jgi:hypothetical protein